MKYASAAGAACSEPCFASAARGYAGSARGESSFSFYCSGAFEGAPACAVAGDENCEPAIDGIADDDAVLGVPEAHAIEKALGVGIGVKERPADSAVDGFINARERAGAGAQEQS